MFHSPSFSNTHTTLLKGGRVLDPASNTDETLDIFITGETITAIGPHLADATGKVGNTQVDEIVELNPSQWVVPGLIDVHVHFRDPGQTHKEDTESGSKAALAGGFTTVCIMPNTAPTLDNLQTLHYVNQMRDTRSKINIYPVVAATQNLAGEALTNMGSLFEQGAVAFTDDGHCLMNAHMMRLALEYTKMFDVPVVCHAEDMNLTAHGCMNEGEYSTKLGLPGIPNVAESVIIGRDIELVRKTGGHVHFAHVSTRESVELIRKAKAEGISVTGETTPHYLTLTDAMVEGYDTDFKMNPPLRTEIDRLALLEGLMDGTLDAIATDHAPHSPQEKSAAFEQAPNGVVGLETSFAVMNTFFVQKGLMTPLTLIDRMSTRPAKIFKLPGGTLRVGAKADITVLDPLVQWTVDPNQFYSKSRNTPFKGMTLLGKPDLVYSSGECVLGHGVTLNPCSV